MSDPAHAHPWILQWSDHGRGGDVEHYDARAVATTLERVRALGRWLPLYPVEALGLERLPPPPALVVMNHSGGDTVLDVWGFMYAWYRHFGPTRPLRPLAHQILLEQPLSGPYLTRRGILKADHEVALAALSRMRHDVLVMPGGDVEAWRPYRERHRVGFAGRTGYVKLSLEAGVPIVPVGHVGAHSSFIVLTRGDRIARALHLHALARADVFPLHLSLPWGLGLGPLPHLPWPTRLRYAIAEPITATPRGAPPTSEAIADLDARVRAAIQSALDHLADSRHPA